MIFLTWFLLFWIKWHTWPLLTRSKWVLWRNCSLTEPILALHSSFLSSYFKDFTKKMFHARMCPFISGKPTFISPWYLTLPSDMIMKSIQQWMNDPCQELTPKDVRWFDCWGWVLSRFPFYNAPYILLCGWIYQQIMMSRWSGNRISPSSGARDHSQD